jgi:adenine-specific DNA-methyltransferase
MPTTAQLRTRLVGKLKELFQLDQPDLDFGFYRIMHAKAKQVTEFLEKDLLQVIEDTFGNQADQNSAAALTNARRELEESLGSDALDENGKLKESFASLPAGKRYLEALAKAAAAKDALSAEGEIYDHLYRFFERYYEDGDFISRRYFNRETAGRAAPFAIPYNGEEVKLHWANADQYYIKTGEYFSNFTIDLAKAPEAPEEMKLESTDSLPVHFRVVDADEGEHGNVKATDATKRFFILHADDPVGFNDKGELELRFEYRPDPDKPEKSQEGAWQEGLRARAVEALLGKLATIPEASIYHKVLAAKAPTEANRDRTLLAKYLHQYTARNTSDYFIHKDLGSFLRRELDFYIKNEVMRLDDIENEDVTRVESYLAKLKVFRAISRQLIDFLAQLENFQKRLWLKKKFITETNYGITIDRVPEELYPEIAASDTQREEWIQLYSIDKIEDQASVDLLLAATPGYTSPLTIEFLKSQPHLVLDTRHFSAAFKANLLESIENFEEQCDGLLVNSENFQGLKLLSARFKDQVQTIYIDPPYNTGGDGFAYKDAYQHASWLSMIQDRLKLGFSYLGQKGVFFSSIDGVERTHLEAALNMVFNVENRIEEIIWVQNTTKNQSPTYSTNHEYVEVYAKCPALVKGEHLMFRETKPGYLEINTLIDELNSKFASIEEIEAALRELYKNHKSALKAEEAEQDEWKGIYNYNRAEYRDLSGKYVEEVNAKKSKARIWVWREVDTGMPQVKKDSQKAEFKDANSPTYRFYTPSHPITGKPCPTPKTGWRWPYLPEGEQKNSFSELAADNRIAWGSDENKIPQRKSFLHEVETNVAKSVINDYTDGEKELANLFGQSRIFGGPKPTTLIQRFCDQSALGNGWFCDFFSGSGTSGQSVMAYNREKGTRGKILLVEAGDHFDTVLKPRIAKVVYSPDWKEGKPVARDKGISYCFKYIRLESYEDTLNNLNFVENSERARALAANESLRRDYTINYLLDVETHGSHSLLSIEDFTDPTAYTLKVKKPGASGSVEQAVDLIETFNFLLGLRVVHLAAPQRFSAKFKRVPDPDLPKGTDTRLQLDGKMKQSADGSWWFRKVEGWVPKDRESPNNGQKEKILIVWRTLTGNLEEDNLMLDEWFQKNRLSTRDFEFDTIYVNGSNNLPNLKLDTDTWKVRLLEEEFHKAMWDVQDV